MRLWCHIFRLVKANSFRDLHLHFSEYANERKVFSIGGMTAQIGHIQVEITSFYIEPYSSTHWRVYTESGGPIFINYGLAKNDVLDLKSRTDPPNLKRLLVHIGMKLTCIVQTNQCMPWIDHMA